MKREVELGILDELLRQLDEKRNVDAGVMYRQPAIGVGVPGLPARDGDDATCGSGSRRLCVSRLPCPDRRN